MFYCWEKGNLAVNTAHGPFKMDIHTHNAIEISLVVRGKVVSSVNDKSITLKSGEMLILDAASCRHKTTINDPGGAVKCLEIIPDDDVRALFGNILSGEQSYYIVPNNSLINEVFSHITSMFFDKDSDSSVIGGLIFLVDLINRYKNNNIVAHIKSFVIDNYYHIYSIDDVAAEFNFSRPHIQRIFKQETGVPLGSYIKSVKMNNACYLLQNTKIPISEIYRSVGMKSNPAFFYLFRTLYRMTPKEYRDSH